VLYAIALREAHLGAAYQLMAAVSPRVVLSFAALHEHFLRPHQAVDAVVILVRVGWSPVTHK